MKEEKKLYEGMYIVSAQLTEDARTKACQKLKEGVSARGGEVVEFHDQGKKRLAYAINNHKEGYYYVMYFMADPLTVTQLWQEYDLNENLVRYITLRANKALKKIEFKPLPEV
jgi:small subunit ribosomal protein S6